MEGFDGSDFKQKGCIRLMKEEKRRFKEEDNGRLLHYLKNVHFTNPAGDEVYFDENGDPPAVYDILNWHRSRDGSILHVKVGTFNSSAPYDEQFVINESAIMWNDRGLQLLAPCRGTLVGEWSRGPGLCNPRPVGALTQGPVKASYPSDVGEPSSAYITLPQAAATHQAREWRPRPCNPKQAGILIWGPVRACYPGKAGEPSFGLRKPILGTLKHSGQAHEFQVLGTLTYGLAEL
ncbi:hypothetical protein NDU88_003078 [Pleurodeles waltl]|uniref:Receptor ligand binding region domain-containing protein n=1 Tax=Pleurodeles waltl TaxID=8319 RepID=A0AAV7LLY8_PLEWA|nr:hypothetical protein NDU88_003078 [Pleurodeles waltl]